MSWFVHLPRWARLAGAVAAFAAVAGLVYVTQARRDAAERTWADVPAWDAMPLHVASELGPEHHNAVVDAVAAINAQAGCAVLELAGDAHVTLRWEGACLEAHCSIPDGHATAGAGTWRSGQRAWVVVRSLPSPRSARLILAHELGHALGLADDELVGTAVHLMLRDVARRDSGGQMPRLSARDAAAVRERYCDGERQR